MTVSYGTAIAWTVPAGDAGRRLVDATGLGLFDSGPLAPADTFTYRFVSAGTFPVTETTSDTAQTVRVRPVARSRPRLGPGTVKVTWAAEDLAAGLVADVQVRLRGGPWKPWIRGTHLPSALYQADPEGGRIAFRARLRAEGSSTALGMVAAGARPARVAGRVRLHRPVDTQPPRAHPRIGHPGRTPPVRHRASSLCAALALAACAVVAGSDVAPAASGNLDRSFGDAGRVITDITRANDSANDVAIQANGKIVAVGRASTRRYYGRFAVTRYRTNGHLDPAFGGDGGGHRRHRHA